MDDKHFPDIAERPSKSFEFRAILLVDDDKQLAETLQWVLADQSFMVDLAYDGEEGLLKVKAHEYDAVVCDVMMPKLRGDQFYVRAIQDRPALKGRFIFITGQSADVKINAFLTKTGCKYLFKPFPVQSLIDSVNQLLG